MGDHATVFYAKPIQHYVLCYDDDLEALPKPTREQVGFGTASIIATVRTCSQVLPMPYEIIYKGGGFYITRICYKPEHTEHVINEDGYVDRFVVFTDDWINRMKVQFDVAFPLGLPATLIKSVIIPEV